MAETNIRRLSATEHAVALLREHARYLDEHAEAIVGDVDKPNFLSEGGIRVSFTLSDDAFPTVDVEKTYLVLNSPRG